ncbi:hypothetical protein M9Y09_18190, partial [Clostridioides difficile]|nr:hypothetical protein [Clostridioides difficile]
MSNKNRNRHQHISSTGYTTSEKTPSSHPLTLRDTLPISSSKITQEQCLLITKKKSKRGFLGIAYSDITLLEEAFENIFRKELELKGFWTSYSA